MNKWPHQEYVLAEVPRHILAGERKLLVTSPTGGGKTMMICDLIEYFCAQGWHSALYTNRRLLIDQLTKVLAKRGIEHGIRAAGHDDRRWLPVQISSLPTERSRVLNSDRWEVHGSNMAGRFLAIVDEAHLNSSSTAQAILQKHHEAGGAYVGFTATPINLAHLYDHLIVAGTQSELRRCGALVPARHYGPDEPDMNGFKPNLKTGEYTENDVKKAIMTKCIFGRVLSHYLAINADQRPAILFAPGVAESIWFAEQFVKEGIRAAHIDGEGIWLDGQYRRTSERQEVLDATRTGDIKVLCNRFVLREGLDLPEVSHLILATVMGSLQTYLQSCGRGLRAALNKLLCTIQDHGGHWHRHGSANADRHWDMRLTETMIAGTRNDRLREKKDQEPICCPNCQAVRSSGSVCPMCKHESQKRSRIVVQQDGQLRQHFGDIYKPRHVQLKQNTEQLWRSMYFRARKSKNRMTFRQAEGLFAHENYYHPPRTLPFMPLRDLDWFLPVADVPRERLRP